MSFSSSSISSCDTVFMRKRSSSDRKNTLPLLPGDGISLRALFGKQPSAMQSKCYGTLQLSIPFATLS